MKSPPSPYNPLSSQSWAARHPRPRRKEGIYREREEQLKTHLLCDALALSTYAQLCRFHVQEPKPQEMSMDFVVGLHQERSPEGRQQHKT